MDNWRKQEPLAVVYLLVIIFLEHGDTISQNYRGHMSDARIYSTALSVGDILDLYNAPIKVTKNGTLMTNGEVIEV